MQPYVALQTLDTEIRNAIAADCFTEATVLLSRYLAEIETRLRAMPPASVQARRMACDALALFEFSTAMTASSRDGAAADLERLRHLGVYQGPGQPSQRLQSEG